MGALNGKDEELLETVLEAFEDDGRLDLDYIDVEVVDESITLSGRVSSEEELEIVDEVMQGIKIADYLNNIWVDESLGLENADQDEADLKAVQFDEEIDDEYDSDDDDDRY